MDEFCYFKDIVSKFKFSVVQRYSFLSQISYNIYYSDKLVCSDLNQYLAYYLEKDDIKNMDERNIYVIIDNEIYSEVLNIISQGHYQHAFIEETGVITSIFLAEKITIHIAKHEMRGLGLLQDVYCAIRRNNFKMLESQGAMILHGTAFSYKDNGFVIVGKKGFGKSYLSEYIACNTNAKLISSDQTVVFFDKQMQLCIYGNIASFRVNLGKQSPVFNGEYSKKAFQDYVERYREEPYRFTNNKLNMSPQEFSETFNIMLSRTAKLKSIIVIDGDALKNQCLNYEESLKFILKNIIFDIPIVKTYSTKHSLNGQQLGVVKEICQNYKVYKIRQNAAIDQIEKLIEVLEIK